MRHGKSIDHIARVALEESILKLLHGGNLVAIHFFILGRNSNGAKCALSDLLFCARSATGHKQGKQQLGSAGGRLSGVEKAGIQVREFLF